MQEERRTSQSETNFGEVWNVALSPFAFGAALPVCQRCGGRTAEKDGGSEEDAAGSPGQTAHLGSGDLTEVEAAKRRKTGLK